MAAGSDPWARFCTRLEVATLRDHPSIAGRYVVNVHPSEKAKGQDVRKLVAAVTQCWREGHGSQVRITDGVIVHNFTVPGALGFRIHWSVAAAEMELGEPSRDRFARAITRKLSPMARAGGAGYETHLAVIHWMLGSTASWRHYLEANPPTFMHPQYIWAIDLNVAPGTQGRSPVEQLHP
jgi:hypothetical protein